MSLVCTTIPPKVVGTLELYHVSPIPLINVGKYRFFFQQRGQKSPDYKQLLDEVCVISRIIEVEVGVISRGRRLRLITLTETSIILDITKTESNNSFIIH